MVIATCSASIKYLLDFQVMSSENYTPPQFQIHLTFLPHYPPPLQLHLSQANLLHGVINWAINLGETISHLPSQSTALFPSHSTKPQTSVLKPHSLCKGRRALKIMM